MWILLISCLQDDPYDQSKVPLEVEPVGSRAAKIVLVAGRPSHPPMMHEYFAGLALLMKMLAQNPGTAPVMAKDGWPKNPKIFDGAKSIVFYCDGGSGHALAKHLDDLQPYIDKGVGFACLHYAVNFDRKTGDRILAWLGGHFDAQISSSPATTWTAEYKAFPEHAIGQGLKPFTLKDEWYFHMRFLEGMKGITPILKAVPPESARTSADAKKHPGEEEITAWAYEGESGGRSFGFTGGHYHQNWGDESIRRLVVNALLWTAKVEVPKDGARVALDPADLNRNLDDKRPKKK